MAFLFVPKSSSYHPSVLFGSRTFFGIEVDDSRDDFWRGGFVKRLYLATRPSHVGFQCGRATLPFAPAYDSQLSGEGTKLICQALSCLITTVGGGAFQRM
jgi:hypothetical protein